MQRRFLIATALLGACSAGVFAQEYPTKGIRVIVPFTPGAGNDTQGRLLARYFQESMGQSVIVDNRPGAAGNLGAEIVARSPADGYTLLFTTATIAANATLRKSATFDPLRDLAPISLVSIAPQFLIVHPSMIAGRAALRHPARFRSLAMYAATAGIPPSRPAKGNWLERVGRDGVRKFLEETAVDRIGQASPEHVRWYIESAAGVTPQFLARFVPLMASDDFTGRMGELDMPVMLGVPDPDPMVDRSEYARLRDHVHR